MKKTQKLLGPYGRNARPLVQDGRNVGCPVNAQIAVYLGRMYWSTAIAI